MVVGFHLKVPARFEARAWCDQVQILENMLIAVWGTDGGDKGHILACAPLHLQHLVGALADEMLSVC